MVVSAIVAREKRLLLLEEDGVLFPDAVTERGA